MLTNIFTRFGVGLVSTINYNRSSIRLVEETIMAYTKSDKRRELIDTEKDKAARNRERNR